MEDSYWKQLERMLPRVTTPGQYVGCEWNASVKGEGFTGTRVALVFPDTYAVGMSHYGFLLLYSILNSEADIACERAFVPWRDMEEMMRQHQVPLLSLETHRPLGEFDVVGFSLQYEMCYTNVLTALDLGGIPLRAQDRTESHPIVIAGGPCAFAPEPLADFIDLFFIGEADEVVAPLVRLIGRMRRDGVGRGAVLERAAKEFQGVYAPAMYSHRCLSGGTFGGFEPVDGANRQVQAVFIGDFENAPNCARPVVPSVEAVHERVQLEIMRGCPHRCRFCQSGTIKGKVRVRSVDRLLEIAKENYAATGYNEISLLSLSATDYPWLDTLISRLNSHFGPLQVNISLPSLRVDKRLRGLPGVLSLVRKSGLTMAPEAASERLRKAIGKEIDEEALVDTARIAYGEGWNVLKLYFMVGLPTETDEDVREIGRLANRVSMVRKEVGRGPGEVNISVSPFVPKAHTAFQWEPMVSVDRINGLREILRSGFRARRMRVKFSDPHRSVLEGVLARGDRRLGRVVESAWRRGARLDAWTEFFDFARWREAFEECGIDPAFYAHRERDVEECLPWDHIDAGISKEQLLKERGRGIGSPRWHITK